MKEIIFMGIKEEKSFVHRDPNTGQRFRFSEFSRAKAYIVPDNVADYLISIKPYLFGLRKDDILKARGIVLVEENTPADPLDKKTSKKVTRKKTIKKVK